MAPTWPKRAPREVREGPKTAPRAPNRRPRGSFLPPMGGRASFQPPSFLSNGAQGRPKKAPSPPKRAPRGPQGDPIGFQKCSMMAPGGLQKARGAKDPRRPFMVDSSSSYPSSPPKEASTYDAPETACLSIGSGLKERAAGHAPPMWAGYCFP